MSKSFHAPSRMALLGAASLLVWGSQAQAQSNPSTIEELVVTAQRRAEALQDVPISVTAVSGQTLEKAGIQRIEDISRISAGVQISRTGIFLQPAIRGVTTAQGNFSENNVAIYVDGFYIPSARGLNTELANISQVQVLKGPQGTLFGRNATGGAILIETQDPSLTERSGRLMGGFGTFKDRRVQTYFSTPITEKVAVNIAGSYRSSDGYIKDVRGFDTAPLELYSLRLKLRIEPTDKLSIIASAGTSKVEDGRALATTTVGRQLAKVAFPNDYIEQRAYRTSYTHPVVNRTYNNTFTLKATYDLGFADLNSYTLHQYESSDLWYEANDGTARNLFDSNGVEEWKTYTQEVNLTSNGDGPLQYVVGAYFFDAKQKSSIPGSGYTVSYPNTTYVVNGGGIIHTKAFALYADATYQAMDNLYLTVGARYSKEEKEAFFYDSGTLRRSGPYDLDDNSITPRAVIRYEFAPDSSVYASYSKGFKSGVLNIVAPFSPVDPEKITAYEVGFKTAQSWYRFDAAAYYYDYKNLQVATVAVVRDALGRDVQASITANAASAEIYGAEAQFAATPMENLNVSASLAYTHARYKEFTSAIVSLPNPATGLNSSSCGINPNPPPPQILCRQDLSGRRMLRAPDWSANISSDYTIPLSFGGDIVLSGNVAYQSFQLTNRSDIDLDGKGYRYGQKGYTLVNLQAAWNSPDDHWTVTVYGNNVFDQNYKIVWTGTAFSDYQTLGEPLTYGAKIEVRF
jgi:iron complex outermembrane receptor protein